MKRIVNVRLHCPDGLDESLSFNIPSELEDMINWINTFNKEEGYTFTLSTYN